MSHRAHCGDWAWRPRTRRAPLLGHHHGGHHMPFGRHLGWRPTSRAVADFLADRPECIAPMVRHHARRMLRCGADSDEIRDYLALLQEEGFLPDLDIDEILDSIREEE